MLGKLLLRILGSCIVLLAASELSSAAERRVALVIGNGNYKNIPKLRNPPKDAQLIANSLRKIGFEILLYSDVTGGAMRTAFQSYSDKLADYGRDTIGLTLISRRKAMPA